MTGEVGVSTHQLLIPSEASKNLKECLSLTTDLTGRPTIWTSVIYRHFQRLLCYSSCVISKVEEQSDMMCYMIHLYLYDLSKDVHCSHFFQERTYLRNVTRARAAATVHPTQPIIICSLDILYRSGNSSGALARTIRLRFGDERRSLFEDARAGTNTSEMIRVNPVVEKTEIGGDYTSITSFS